MKFGLDGAPPGAPPAATTPRTSTSASSSAPSAPAFAPSSASACTSATSASSPGAVGSQVGRRGGNRDGSSGVDEAKVDKASHLFADNLDVLLNMGSGELGENASSGVASAGPGGAGDPAGGVETRKTREAAWWRKVQLSSVLVCVGGVGCPGARHQCEVCNITVYMFRDTG